MTRERVRKKGDPFIKSRWKLAEKGSEKNVLGKKKEHCKGTGVRGRLILEPEYGSGQYTWDVDTEGKICN